MDACDRLDSENFIGHAQKYLQENGEVQLSALGVAISSLVTVAEILKSRELAVVKKITTTMESREDGEESTRSRQKPKMEVILTKSEKFEEILAAEAAENASKSAAQAEGEEQKQ